MKTMVELIMLLVINLVQQGLDYGSEQNPQCIMEQLFLVGAHMTRVLACFNKPTSHGKITFT